MEADTLKTSSRIEPGMPSVPTMPARSVAVCAACEVPIPGRIVLCARCWCIIGVPRQKALIRCHERGTDNKAYEAAVTAAVEVVRKHLARFQPDHSPVPVPVVVSSPVPVPKPTRANTVTAETVNAPEPIAPVTPAAPEVSEPPVAAASDSVPTSLFPEEALSK